MKHFCTSKAIAATLAAGALATAFSAPAQASVVYGFKFAAGAQNLQVMKDAGNYIFAEVAENLSTPANDVLFKITSSIPQPVSGIGRIAFDMGSYASLFSSMSIYDHSPGDDMIMLSPTTHPYLPSLTPEYMVGYNNQQLYDSRSINPGEFLTLSATLGGGITYTDVLNAMNTGIAPATASNGLRIGVIAYNLLGTRINPNVTLMDDAGFVTGSIASVPLPAALPLMMAGLGLMGFAARRKA